MRAIYKNPYERELMLPFLKHLARNPQGVLITVEELDRKVHTNVIDRALCLDGLVDIRKDPDYVHKDKILVTKENVWAFARYPWQPVSGQDFCNESIIDDIKAIMGPDCIGEEGIDYKFKDYTVGQRAWEFFPDDDAQYLRSIKFSSQRKVCVPDLVRQLQCRNASFTREGISEFFKEAELEQIDIILNNFKQNHSQFLYKGKHHYKAIALGGSAFTGILKKYLGWESNGSKVPKEQQNRESDVSDRVTKEDLDEESCMTEIREQIESRRTIEPIFASPFYEDLPTVHHAWRTTPYFELAYKKYRVGVYGSVNEFDNGNQIVYDAGIFQILTNTGDFSMEWVTKRDVSQMWDMDLIILCESRHYMYDTLVWGQTPIMKLRTRAPTPGLQPIEDIKVPEITRFDCVEFPRKLINLYKNENTR